MNLTTIRTDLQVHHDTTLVLDSYYTSGERKLRIHVESNAYAFQSVGVAELFDGTRWNNVARLQPESVPAKLAYSYQHAPHKQSAIDQMRATEKQLIELATAVLS